ncbi:MAG: ABC transporter ATP-binding protein, partial [Lachnospiraceae bacterium]|nr:ABC transporter ATP-binding protein [Lachnospiraceae bacterium]
MQPSEAAKKEYSSKELFTRFFPYLFKYKFTLFADLACAAMTTGCDLALPLIMRYITNVAITGTEGLSMETILKLGGLYLLLRIVDCAAGYYMTNMGHVMGTRIETDMRRDAYAHLQRLSDTYFNNTKIGQIMGRITNDLFDVTEFAHHCPEEFFIAFIKITLSFVILMTVNIPLTLIVFLFVPLMLFVCIRVNGRLRRIQRSQRVQIGELNASIEDSLLGHRVVKAFTNEEQEEAKFDVNNVRFFDLKKEFYAAMSFFHTTMKAFDAAMYVTVLLLGSIFLLKGAIEPGDLVAYLLYITTLITTVRRIIEFAEQFQRGMTGIDRFLQIIDADIEIFDEPGAVDIRDPKGDIVFEDVSFEYPDDH